MFGYSLDPDFLKNLDSPAGAAALVNLCGAVLLAITGWIVTGMIAWATTRITRGQLAVAHNKLILDVLEKRLECRGEIESALDVRSEALRQMMIGSSPPKFELEQNVQAALDKARVLFSQDVTDHIVEATLQQDLLEPMIAKHVRTENKETESSDRILRKFRLVNIAKTRALDAIDSYSYLGEVRVTARRPRKSVKETLSAGLKFMRMAPSSSLDQKRADNQEP